MKKMSGILAVLTAFAVGCSSACAMTVNPVSVNQNSGDISVSGRLSGSGQKSIVLHLINAGSEDFDISKASDDDIKSATRRFLQQKSNDDGTFQFEFNINEVTDDEGIFILRLGSEGENTEQIIFRNYKNSTLDGYRELINGLIRDNKSETAVSDMSDLIKEHYEKFLTDCSLIEQLIDKNMIDAFSAIMLTMDEFESNQELINGIQTAAVIELMNLKVGSAEEYFDKYSANLEIENFEGYADYKKFDAAEKTQFFETFENLSSESNSLSDFVFSFSGAVLFTQLENNHGIKGKEAVLRGYPSLLSFEVFDKSGNDTDAVIKEIESGMKSGTVKAVADIQGILNTYIAKKDGKKDSGSGGGSPGVGIGLKNQNSDAYNPEAKVDTVKRGEFTDLEEFGWARESIERLAKIGILSGVSETKFEPDRNVTRAEFAKMLCGCFGIIPDSTNTAFGDVPENEWFAGYVSALVKRGIVNGRSDALFAPYEEITREEMAVITYRAGKDLFEKPTAGSLEFSDNADISEFAVEAVTALTGGGYLNGMPDGSFKPKNSATRAEAAKFMDGAEKFVSGGAQ